MLLVVYKAPNWDLGGDNGKNTDGTGLQLIGSKPLESRDSVT